MKHSVIFVCAGNICRSPTAEGIFRKFVADAGMADRFEIDSAGTNGYHVGDGPDPRAQRAAVRRGYDLSGLRARKFERSDFRRFDIVLAADLENRDFLSRLAQPSNAYRLRMMMDFAKLHDEREVPDPYYGGDRGFEQVIDMLEDAARGLLEALRAGENAPIASSPRSGHA
jgi:protein-tyrosine phosphatase